MRVTQSVQHSKESFSILFRVTYCAQMRIPKKQVKQHLSFRVTAELIEGLDAIVKRERKAQDNETITRSDVIIAILTDAIAKDSA